MVDMNNLAYLASEYPAISHTFIFREVQALREQGYSVITASINDSKNVERMTPEEQRDKQETFYIKSARKIDVFKDHLCLFFSSPVRYFRLFRNAHRLMADSSAVWMKRTMYFVEAVLVLRWMKRNSATHLHVHFANPAASVAMIAASYGTFSYSISLHGPDVFYDITGNALVRKIQLAAGVRCISHYCRSQAMRLVPPEDWAKFRIIRCGIDPEIFDVRSEPDNKTPEVLCLGRLVPAKGQHILLDAVGSLLSEGENVHLTFVGDGPDRAGLEQVVAEHSWEKAVTFTGAVGQSEVHQYYDKADIFVLPSFAEGLPVVLMESMAKGIATVSTYINGIPELIRDGENGRLVYASDIKSLVKTIRDLLKNPEERRRLGENGRETVFENYNLRNNCRGMADFFEDIIHSSRDVGGKRS